jgi:NAD(P)-dependent dehydrogenase (short-subunit alcohol dehydrogenase family)
MTPERKVVVITGASRGIGAQLSKFIGLDCIECVCVEDHQGHLRLVRNGSSVKRGVDDVLPASMVPVGSESL